ncbi:TonB-dependent siderophore receptor [Bordetella bronchiseptica]|uniref:TonB-dependent siderophore receptor n=4 Tax=Bordetella bronchiseptica TaxID=518 RepID=A0ABR4RKG3_BORBO|nr:TonB-dependent receptor [Bordetella bronchiseptica]KCV38065.1 TonB-dependent siderophore receptor [Bordetella bronchiseptica 00-P-2796]KDB95714.1 TonB-dependent siderophore receptor [Bordetella bronchiseptica E010]KDC02350.1 TonB-dependent siderophore receptor [Bordetella bronchiseptica E012]KDC09754.1 TonB-dependent siderophore receptor [Bordetella bronchiseptica E013]KDC66595.1 TonB-dependent siderophore receptor [Bordetella bronchiseptica MBORD624]KDD27573.1 TonB-dependent siderophore r
MQVRTGDMPLARAARMRTHWRAAALAAILAHAWLPPGVASAQPAQALEQPLSFDMAPQPLGQALIELNRRTALSIAFDPRQVEHFQAPAIRGVMTSEQALRQALSGSNLAYSLRGQVATVRQQEVAQLMPVTVSGDNLPAYIADTPTSIATKTSLPPRQTPFTINQASQELIMERGDANIYDTLEGFAGVTTTSGNGDIGQSMSRSINVRGFSTGGAGQLLINGQRTYSSASAARSPDSLERVELLRGPAALYYGAAEPGGIVNYTYKRPQAQAAYTIVGRTDSKGSYGSMVDMTGPLNQDDTLLYRLVGSYTHTVDDQDHIFQEPKSVLAALTYAPNSRFDTTLTYERMEMEAVPEQENNMRISNRNSPYYGQYYPVPRDFFWGSLNDRAVTETDTLLWDARWRPSERFNLNAYANYQESKQWWQNTRVNGAGNGPDADGNVQRYVSGRQARDRNWSFGLDLSGKAYTGAFRHDWLTGAGYGHTQTRSSGRQVAADSRPGQPYTPGPLNIFDPDYGNWHYQDRIWEDPLAAATKRNDLNLYFQDMLHLPDEKTRLLLAMGWAQFDSRPPDNAQRNKISKWSPRIALMHDLTPSTTVYASYGESFYPNELNLLDMSGSYITKPQEGKQYEIGFKQDLFDSRAMLTAALFRIDKKNMPMSAQPDGQCDPLAAPAPGTPGTTDGSGDCRTSLSGLERSQGLELELSGLITDWWAASLSYAYLKTEYVDTEDPFSQGRSKPNMPAHNLALWNKFRVYQDPVYGTAHVAVGLRAWSKSHNAWRDPAVGTYYNPYSRTDYNPGYGIVDVGVFYANTLANGMDLKLQLNIKNLFNKTYYDRNRFANGTTIVWGNERRAMLNAQLSF